MIMCPTGSRSSRSPLPNTHYAVFVMAYGAPTSLDDVEGFVMDIRGGRKTPPELIEEIRQRYALIGGRSPLLDITSEQAEALETLLNAPDDDEQHTTPQPHYKVYMGMRHWFPYIHDTMPELVQSGLKDVIALCMTPFYSEMTVGAYVTKFQEAMAANHANLNVTYVKNWHTHPLYIEAVAEKVKAALDRFAPDVRHQVQIIFSAHSLPASILEKGDPYDAQLKEASQLVINRLEMGAVVSPPLSERWQFCYQSAGAQQVVWLGPPLEEVIGELAEAGHKHILVVPIGFLTDHVEILYDIDIECASLALELGVDLKRIDSLNTSPLLIEALADIVQQAAEQTG